jgi:Predicted aminoglycoside phosphotransferase
VPLTDAETTALEHWVSSNCREQVTTCEVIADGVNLVVAVTTADGSRYVVRSPNILRDTPMFVDVETEYRTLDRLVTRDVPAPRPVGRCTDDSVLGAPFVLMTRLEGGEVPLGSRLPQRYQHPRARERLGHELIDTLAGIHTVPTDPFETVCETHTLAEQLAADRSRVERAADSVPASFTELQCVGDWLAENVPETDHRVLVHGDYRPGNTLFVDASDESSRTGDRCTAGAVSVGCPRLGDTHDREPTHRDRVPPLAVARRRGRDPVAQCGADTRVE